MRATKERGHAQGESLTAVDGQGLRRKAEQLQQFVAIADHRLQRPLPGLGLRILALPLAGLRAIMAPFIFIDVSRGMQWRAILPTNSNRA
ncbi:hypothetical protein [Candidatus Accumulibacter contiguus]|jgi:hypothetical protein|uniref:hypothetical protein n=1 Tax=Candidatus Accumulibacter contiguus TaxID=2954381 RepID=UPI002FC346C1